MSENEPGRTQDFVMAQGFQEVGGFTVLLGQDGGRRLLAEIYADPDRPEARPQEAYRDLLASLAPGWTLRLLQVTWPDPGPRQAFLARMDTWGAGEAVELQPNEALKTLQQGLRLYLEAFPLPYRRRTLLEFVLPPGDEALGWWGGIAGSLARYGLRLVPLGREEILALARHLLNPELE
jgi:hypothetical protein